MKKIGVIDYYLDEWHSNHYPEWIENVYKESNSRDFILAYAYADIDKKGGLTTDEWCRKYNIKRICSIGEIVEKSDAIIVFSPDNPEQHLRLSELPIMSGKPVFIDKTFSPDLKTGIKMFDNAEKYRTPLFSSSCLRYSDELLTLKQNINQRKIEYVATQGPGSFEIYGVHQLEMIISLLSTGAKRVKSFSTLNGRMFVIDFGDGRLASMTQFAELPYSLSVAFNDGSDVHVKTVTHLFENLITDMFKFFNTGIPPVKKEETLEIMALIDACKKSMAESDKWIEVY